MAKRYTEQLDQPNHPEAEDAVLRALIRGQRDAENRERWAQQLQATGIQKDVTFRTFFTPRRLLALAAAFLVLLAAVWFVGKQPQPQALADGYIAQNGPFRFPSNHRGNDQTANWRTRAAEAYQSEHYADAAKILETATPSPDSLDGADWFLLGAAHFYAGNSEAAIPCFEKAQTKAPQYADDLKWHLALAYLRLGKPDQARPFLTALANDPRSIYASSAHDCLERLGR